MAKYSAFLFGFMMVVAYVPGWSQPSIEPKSALLLTGGGVAWVWLARKGWPLARYTWGILLPIGWLTLSSFWSPFPFFGLQRLIWILAALGIGTLLQQQDRFESFMKGFLAGTGIHALMILLQWIPAARASLPSSLGIDPFQGIGRGLFHNTNMAALPFVILVGWFLLSSTGHHWRGHLVWVLPALTLTQSRLGIGVCSGVIVYTSIPRAFPKGFSWSEWLGILSVLLGAGWGVTAHRWGWLVPAGGCILALCRNRKAVTEPDRPNRILRFLPTIGLVLAVTAGVATRDSKNAALRLVQGRLVEGDVSFSQRLSYYRAAGLAFLDHPLVGQGLGSARPVYPRFVDRDRPAAEIAYGDFQRPNNLHSEPLEWLVEGGLPVLFLALLGSWLDRRSSQQVSRGALLVPVALIALMDFPFHNPLGLLWVGLTLAPKAQTAVTPTSRATRFLHGVTALSLLVLAGGQVRAAMLRLGVEQRFAAASHPAQTLAEARSLWKGYPFAADLFDLYSKSAIQNAAVNADAASVQELDQLLAWDPFDHHLLLCRAQVARRLGDLEVARSLLSRYATVAPRDPDRYLRLARTALDQGKPDSARQLMAEARRQPGFSPGHAREIEILESRIPMTIPDQGTMR